MSYVSNHQITLLRNDGSRLLDQAFIEHARLGMTSAGCDVVWRFVFDQSLRNRPHVHSPVRVDRFR